MTLKGGFVTIVAVELGLFGLFFGTIRLLAAQAEIAIEFELQRAGFILEQLVDDSGRDDGTGAALIMLMRRRSFASFSADGAKPPIRPLFGAGLAPDRPWPATASPTFFPWPQAAIPREPTSSAATVLR